MMPDPVPRAFSHPVAEALAKAINEYDPQSPQTDDALRLLVVRATAEARSQGWRPEELIAALRAAIPERDYAPGVRDALHAALKRRALVAFFGTQMSAF